VEGCKGEKGIKGDDGRSPSAPLPPFQPLPSVGEICSPRPQATFGRLGREDPRGLQRPRRPASGRSSAVHPCTLPPLVLSPLRFLWTPTFTHPPCSGIYIASDILKARSGKGETKWTPMQTMIAAGRKCTRPTAATPITTDRITMKSPSRWQAGRCQLLLAPSPFFGEGS
jgi:hypothetical protein